MTETNNDNYYLADTLELIQGLELLAFKKLSEITDGLIAEFNSDNVPSADLSARIHEQHANVVLAFEARLKEVKNQVKHKQARISSLRATYEEILPEDLLLDLVGYDYTVDIFNELRDVTDTLNEILIFITVHKLETGEGNTLIADVVKTNIRDSVTKDGNVLTLPFGKNKK